MAGMDDIDIFDGSVGQIARRQQPKDVTRLSPAQLTNIGAAFADPLGMIDITGEFPEFPAAGVSTAEMVMQGPRSPSLMENLREGDFGAAALQGIGVVPVVGGAARAIRGLAKGADRLARAQKAGFDTDTVYYHATEVFDEDAPHPSYVDFSELKPSKQGKLGPGVYLADNPTYAERYIRRQKGETLAFGPKGDFGTGARILPLLVRGKLATKKEYFEALDKMPSLLKKEFDEIDASFEGKFGGTYDARQEKNRLQKQKVQEVLAEDGFSGFKVDEEVVVFDPKNVRSVNAEFEDLDSPELLKASGGAVQGFSKGGILDLIVKGDFDPRFDPRIKEQEMLRNLEAEIIASDQTQPMPRLALSELEGEDFVTSMTDRTRAGGEVKSINRVELVDPVFLPGGQDFMFNNPSAVWASAEKPSREILELARELKSESGKDPLYIPWRMAPTGGDFSTTTGELMLGYAAANMTKRTKKALDKAIRDYRTIGSMKGGKRVGAGRKIEGWKGLDDPSSVQVWRNTPDAVRKELMNMMDVQFRDKGGLSIGAARLINADPKQLTARDAGIQNVGRIFADADISSSTHPSYPFAVPGGGVGVLDSASEATVFDLLPQARFGAAQKPVKDPANPTAQEIRALQMKPYGGTITEDILRRMEARGVDVNSIVGLTGGALTFTLLSAGLITPQEVQAGGIKQFVSDVPTADKLKQAKVGKKLLSGKTDDAEKGIGSIPVDDETVRGSDLQFLMNISPEGLRRQQELGSFPMPSIAVVKQDQPFQGFGSITLVGDPASFDPKRLKANVVFNADAYTVRAPKPFRLAKKGAYRDFQERFAIVGKEFNEGRIDDLVYNLEELETKKRAVAHEYGDVLRFLNDDVIADVVFLRDRGVTEIPTEASKVRPELSFVDREAVRDMVKPLKKERMEWARKEADKLFRGEEFFDASVNRDYVTGKGLIIKPFTAEEVLKFMKKRKGAAKEENMLTPGSLRASLTERLRSLPEIRAQSGKLVGNEEMTKFQNASYSRINDLAENLAPFYKYKADRLGFQDEVLGLLMDSENIGLERALTRYGFAALPEDVVKEIQRTKSFFKNAPTEYFEAKPERLVDLEEFEGAIVPEGTSEDLIEALKDAGIQIETYATPDDPQRLAARKKFEGTAFSVAGGITLVGLMAPEESYAAGPSNYAKINKAVEEQARKDAAKEGRDFDDVKAMSVQQARAATRRAEAAPFEVVLDALSGGTRQIAGGLAGLAQFREDLPRRVLGDLTDEQAAGRIEAMREGVSEALDYEPTSELGRELSQRAQEGIARLAAPAVRTLEPVVTGAVEQITDPQNVSPLGLLYRGGKYLYEDIFGEPEREAAKSAMDVAL